MREARLHFKLYLLLISVKQAVHRGPAQAGIDSVSLCASAQSIGTETIYQMETFWSLFLPQKSELKTAQYARGKGERRSSKASEILCSTVVTQAV